MNFNGNLEQVGLIKKDIIVIGELNIDIILDRINGFPVIGSEIIADSMNITLGSSSAIFACNIATLGITTAFCGIVGRDSFGKFIVNELKNKNVDTSYVIESERHHTGATVVLNYSNDRANITNCGAMEVFNAENLPVEIFSQFRHLHFSSYFLQKGMQPHISRLYKTAKQYGMTTSLDLQWDPENKWNFPYEECLPHVDIFLPNQAEISKLAGEEDLYKALEKIGAYANKIIVKQGTKGAVAYDKGNIIVSKPFLHKHFVDAIGAGDSFNAGFIRRFLEGCSMEESLELANLAGAVNTMASGGTTAFKSLEAFNKKVKEIFNIVL